MCLYEWKKKMLKKREIMRRVMRKIKKKLHEMIIQYKLVCLF